MGGINRKRIYISRAARVINGRPLGRIHKVKGGLLRAYIPLPFLSLSFLLLPWSLVTRNLAVHIPRDVEYTSRLRGYPVAYISHLSSYLSRDRWFFSFTRGFFLVAKPRSKIEFLLYRVFGTSCMNNSRVFFFVDLSSRKRFRDILRLH